MKLLRLLSWPYLRRHVLRWVLTVGGIVIGVAVLVAMHTANRSIFSSFDETVNKIAGTTQLQVSAGEFGFDESILERVQSVPEVGVAVPVLESSVEVATGGQGRILLLGIDMVGDRSLRDFQLQEGDDAVIKDTIEFVSQPDSILVTRELADRHKLKLNSTLTLVTVDGEKAFTVRGIMKSSGLAQAFGGNLAVMYIYAAQQVLGRGPRFDRIDVRPKEGVSLEQCRRAVKNVLGASFEVEAPSARGRYFEALLQSYSNAMSISSLFALVVGMYIIYNSFSIAVTHRRAEIGILRALGASGRQIQGLFLMESAAAGLVGSAIGVVVGLVIASVITSRISAIFEQNAGFAQRATDVSLDPTLIAVAMVIGVVTSVLAAWIPARGAAAVDPVKALQKGSYQVLSKGQSRGLLRMAAVFGLISIACLFLSRSKPFFYAGYVMMLITGMLLMPGLTLMIAKGLRPILKRFLPAEGALAADALVQAPRRTAATVSALALALAMVVAFGGFARAFSVSLSGWMQTALNPDFFISPSANLMTRAITFPASMSAVIEGVPGVDQVQLVRNARVRYDGGPVMVMAVEAAKLARTMRRIPVAGTEQEMNRLTSEGKGLIASDTFAKIHKLQLGDIVELPTPSGSLKLPIAGIVRDYSDMKGSVFIDRAVYLKWWNDDTANLARVYVKKGADVVSVRQKLIAAISPHHHLLVLTNSEVRTWIVTLIDRWFVLTYGQIAVAILVAVLGIVNTLTVSITDRRRELGVMQAVGGMRNQIRRTIWAEAVGIALIGLLLGNALGSINLYYALGMVKRDLGGIDLAYIFPIGLAVFSVPTILLAAFGAAIGPAEAALRRPLGEALEYE